MVNDEHGIHVTGTTINILNNVIELNKKAGIFVSTQNYSMSMLNIENNHFEINKDGHIVFDLYPSMGNYVYGCNIEKNYLNLSSNEVNVGITSIIRATTDNINDGIVSIYISKSNFVYTDTLKHVSLGNSIRKDGQSRIETQMIGDSAEFSQFYEGLGTCGVDHYQKTMIVNGHLTSKGIVYSSYIKSDNIISILPSINAIYPIALSNGKHIKKIGVRIETNSTNYAVTFSISKQNSKTGVSAGLISDTVSLNNGSKYIEMSDVATLTSTDTFRLQAYEEYYFSLQFTNVGGGDNFQVCNPVITYVE